VPSELPSDFFLKRDIDGRDFNGLLLSGTADFAFGTATETAPAPMVAGLGADVSLARTRCELIMKLTTSDIERQRFVLDQSALPEPCTRNRHHVVFLWIGGVDRGQLAVAGVLDEVGGLSFIDGHVAFDGKQAGHQLADQHDDDARVQEDNARAFPGQLEADRMSGQHV